jgi:hypothetical protein
MKMTNDKFSMTAGNRAAARQSLTLPIFFFAPLLLCAFALSSFAQSRSTLMVSNATGALAAPLNFFTANSNLLNAALGSSLTATGINDQQSNTWQFGYSEQHNTNGTISPQLPYHGATINENQLYWFYNAMNPMWNTNFVAIVFTGDSTASSAQGVFQEGIFRGLSPWMNFGGGIGNWAVRTPGQIVGTPGPNLTSTLIDSTTYLSPFAHSSGGPDANWYGPYFILTNAGTMTNVCYTGPAMVPWSNIDNVQVIYLTGPNAGSFTVSTATGFVDSPGYMGPQSHPLTLLATVNAQVGTGVSAIVTNFPVSGNYSVVVSNVSGTNLIIGASGVRLHGHNFLYYDFSFGGQNEIVWTNVNPNVLSNVMAGVNASLVVLKNNNTTPAQMQSGGSNFLAFWSSNAPYADQIHIGRYSSSNMLLTGGVVDTDYNAPLRQACIAAGKFYFDAYDAVPTNAWQMQQLGWFQNGGLTNMSGTNLDPDIHLYPWSEREGGYLWNEMWGQLGGVDWFNTNYFEGSLYNMLSTASTAPTSSTNGLFTNLTVNGGGAVFNGNFTVQPTNQSSTNSAFAGKPFGVSTGQQGYPTIQLQMHGTPFMEIGDGGSSYGVLYTAFMSGANGWYFQVPANPSLPMSDANASLVGQIGLDGGFRWGPSLPASHGAGSWHSSGGVWDDTGFYGALNGPLTTSNFISGYGYTTTIASNLITIQALHEGGEIIQLGGGQGLTITGSGGQAVHFDDNGNQTNAGNLQADTINSSGALYSDRIYAGGSQINIGAQTYGYGMYSYSHDFALQQFNGVNMIYPLTMLASSSFTGFYVASPTNTVDINGSADVRTNLYVVGNLQAGSFSTTNGGGGIATGGTTNLMIQTNAVGPHGYTLQFTNGLFINAIAY